MKIFKTIIAALLVVCALFLIYTSYTAKDSLPGLLERMDPQNLAETDSQMQRAKKRVTDGLMEDNKEKTLRGLERYLNGFADKLVIDTQVQYELFAYQNGPSMIAGGSAPGCRHCTHPVRIPYAQARRLGIMCCSSRCCLSGCISWKIRWAPTPC